MKKILLAIGLVLVMVSMVMAASFVMTNAGRNMGSTGYIGASPGGLNAGTMEIQAVDNTVLAVFTLKDPVGTSSNGVLTITAPDDATGVNAPTGLTATKAVIKNTAGTAIATADVGTTGASVILSSTTITTGDTVHCVSAPTLTVPAGT